MKITGLLVLAAWMLFPAAGRAAGPSSPVPTGWNGPVAVTVPIVNPAMPLENAWSEGARIFNSGLRSMPMALPRFPGRGFQTFQGPEPTPLQKHVAFFDRNGDGIITVAETTEGLRLLGFGWFKAKAIALAIHLGLGPKTSGRWNSLDIHIKNIETGKHAGDTGVFDEKGFFVPAAFERLFSRFDADRSGSLSEPEIAKMIAAHRAERPGGAIAACAEFSLLLDIAADRTETEEGKPVRAISKEQLKRFYDGSLLYELAKRRAP